MTNDGCVGIIINVVASDALTTRANLENDTERKEDKERTVRFRMSETP